jgi:peptidoglycan/xylan/chitin deacetylase (PgdA/CDA1 family)
VALIALKVDVDTWRGTREGAPALARLLEQLGANATFLFSLGPDHTGRAIRRVFRRGFFSKVARTSVLDHYGWRTLLYGTLLPGPDIGLLEAETLRAIARAGFETGVHCWDHVRWQDGVAHASEAWTRKELQRATERYAEIFSTPPAIHGAAGWQMNDSAYRIEAELGYRLASDTRGTSPYVAVDAYNRATGPVQLPTTLPTLDELIGRDGWDPSNVHRALLAAAQPSSAAQVYTLHAELEGHHFLETTRRVLDTWRAEGHTLVSLGQLGASLNRAVLPRCRTVIGSVPGRSATLAVQGPGLDDPINLP